MESKYCFRRCAFQLGLLCCSWYSCNAYIFAFKGKPTPPPLPPQPLPTLPHEAGTSRQLFVRHVASAAAGLLVGVGATGPGHAWAAEKKKRPEVWADIDGQLGIVWGGRDRCQPSDAACQDNGQDATNAPVLGTPVVEDSLGYEVSDKVYLDVSVGGQPAGRVLLGLWRGAAPTAVEVFTSLCKGELSTRDAQGLVVGPWSFEGSTVDTIKRNKEINMGKMKIPSYMGRKAKEEDFLPRVNADSTAAKHVSAGLVTVQKGGRSFRFSITSGPDPKLDRSNVVIGQVLEGMDVVSRVNLMPVNKYSGHPMAKVTIDSSGQI